MILLTIFVCGVPQAEDGKEVLHFDRYFPDVVGYVWRFQGTVSQESGQAVARYDNTTRIRGTKLLTGVSVTIVEESNAANQGPRQSYFEKTGTGLIYYGSDPPSPIEKALCMISLGISSEFEVAANGSLSFTCPIPFSSAILLKDSF